MPKAKPGACWYDRLTEAEAREVFTLDTILVSLKAALRAASERRGQLQRRAHMRSPTGRYVRRAEISLQDD